MSAARPGARLGELYGEAFGTLLKMAYYRDAAATAEAPVVAPLARGVGPIKALLGLRCKYRCDSYNATTRGGEKYEYGHGAG